MLVRIDTAKIADWQTFHAVFADALGFPEFYGRNMDAWIDCMSSLGAPGDGLTRTHILPGEILVLQLDGAKDFKTRCPAQYAAIVECSAFVNWRRLERGAPAVLALSYCS